MASKTKAAPVGSAPWTQSEREQASQFVGQEAEEFGFSVRNEMDWLNEHMADIFSRNNVTFADIFKTPGKLRGRTPRTTRKAWDGRLGATRQPLTDIFAPSNAPTSAPVAPLTAQKHNAFYDRVAQFQIAEDNQENLAPVEHRPISRSKSPQRVGKPGNTDSGYHGMGTDDEMDVDGDVESDGRTETATASSQEEKAQSVPLREERVNVKDMAEGGQVSDESFMSAREEMASRHASKEQLRDASAAEDEDVNVEMVDEPIDVEQEVVPDEPMSVDAAEDAAEPMDEDFVDNETPHAPSDDASSPEKPLQRKSSFTFSALPAREPLTAKRSMGFRDSQVDAGRNSVLARSFGTKRPYDQDEEEENSPEKAEETKAHHKTTTQILHERITMLGTTKAPRTSKSIAQNALGTVAATYPTLPDEEDAGIVDAVSAKDDVLEPEVGMEDEDDDWIAPSKPVAPAAQQSKTYPMAPPPASSTPEGSPRRPVMHQKSISTTHVPSPVRPAIPQGHQKAQSVSHPNFANAAGMLSSTTPVGSPMGKKHHDGPLSASKNKLWSALKTAKNIFASSASASAAAKLEAHNSPALHRSPKRDFSDESRTAGVYNMPGAMYSHTQFPPPQSPGKAAASKAESIISASPSRKTRSSTESDKKREKEMRAQAKAQDKADKELEKVREKERVKAMKIQEEKRKADEAEAAKQTKLDRAQAEQRPTSATSDGGEMGPPPPPKSMLPAGKLRAPGRLIKPTRAEPSGRPAPVSIRVASQSQRLGQPGPATNNLSRSRDESMAPPPPPKTGLRTASAQGNVRGSVAPAAASTRGVKALEAAAKKREADEKAAAKKAEQKRELERKRAAKAEEERRAEEERKAVEQARLQEARLAAQRKAEAEVKRREAMRQQQEEMEREKQRKAHELADAIKRERAAAAAQAQPARGDVGGTLRQLAKNTVPANAKPTKRVFQPSDEEEQPPRPGLQRAAPSYQQNDAKRRRTNEEDMEERHSVMAPPKRPSNMRKESTLNKFPHGYTHAPPPAAHHATGGAGNASSMFKSTVTAQHQLQHGKPGMPSHPSQTVQMSNMRIPFAENANPPAAAQSAYPQQSYTAGNENAQQQHAASSKFKTPGRPAQAPKSAKSSPLYPNGDAIQLPEIMTDSEDEDSEDENTGFRAPSWVASPALRDLLTQQQLVDPETVFGPIAELKMEEVFKGGKNGDRMKRFRDRGSSAAWVESGDAVTSAEKRRDMEARERVVREGGWRFEPAA